MGSVRAGGRAAWNAHGHDLLSLGTGIPNLSGRQTGGQTLVPRGRRPVSDLLYIGLTIVVFGVLYLIVKGIETFER
jgi:hypothetical protein